MSCCWKAEEMGTSHWSLSLSLWPFISWLTGINRQMHTELLWWTQSQARCCWGHRRGKTQLVHTNCLKLNQREQRKTSCYQRHPGGDDCWTIRGDRCASGALQREGAPGWAAYLVEDPPRDLSSGASDQWNKLS